jgi:hypothetical protein
VEVVKALCDIFAKTKLRASTHIVLTNATSTLKGALSYRAARKVSAFYYCPFHAKCWGSFIRSLLFHYFSC